MKRRGRPALLALLRRTVRGRQLEFLLRRWRAGERFRGGIPEACRPRATDAPYPPYHTGLYLEECFFEYARRRTFRRIYVPVFWTTCYRTGRADLIQQALYGLSPRGRYFTVSQHDRAPQEVLPPDTLVFAAGGLYRGPNCVPIPLVCAPLRERIEVKPKSVFCSFVGSLTHPVRSALWETHHQDPDFQFVVADHWTRDVTPERFEQFVHISERSRFVLCPRGVGTTSFRLYEAMQLGSVPVYVSDAHHLPWTDELDWNDIAVLVGPDDIPGLKERLRAIDDNRYRRMLGNIRRLYDDYFRLPAVCRHIEKRVA